MEGDAEGKDRYTTRAEVEGIATMAAKAAANETVTRLFAVLGVNIANFDSVEKLRDDLDFIRALRSDPQELKELRLDLEFLRSIRVSTKKATGRFVWTIVTVMATAIAVAILAWAKDKLHL